jgi:S-DNA-T family DNA segregation ATPase FtsK/SpoIIIE
VPASVVSVGIGPRETEFILEPALYGRRRRSRSFSFGRVKSRAKDLAVALAVPKVSVELVTVDQPGVAIRVPKERAEKVAIRDVLESESFTHMSGSLRLALGKDAHGSALTANLRELPHLLIGGTVGSGKSICIHAIAVSLLLQNTPDTLHLVMVDTKQVELACYNDIPHLLRPVLVEAASVIKSLSSLWEEAANRFRWLQETGSRDVDDFNFRSLETDRPHLPYIVVIMDEILDIALESSKKLEDELGRLVRVGRAAGIHFVIATSRPSLPVLTPQIKSNFRGRIAFRMVTRADARTILDSGNPEKLAGNGDMLCRIPGLDRLVQAQGAFVSYDEVDRVTDFWRDAASA